MSSRYTRTPCWRRGPRIDRINACICAGPFCTPNSITLYWKTPWGVWKESRGTVSGVARRLLKPIRKSIFEKTLAEGPTARRRSWMRGSTAGRVAEEALRCRKSTTGRCLVVPPASGEVTKKRGAADCCVEGSIKPRASSELTYSRARAERSGESAIGGRARKRVSGRRSIWRSRPGREGGNAVGSANTLAKVWRKEGIPARDGEEASAPVLVDVAAATVLEGAASATIREP